MTPRRARGDRVALAGRDAKLAEMMDDPDCDPARLRRTLERFHLVNRAVARWAAAYQTHLRPALARLGRPARVLDIGCGAGDVLRDVVRRARRDGFEVQALGIDPDERAIAVAEQHRPPGVSWRPAFSAALVGEGDAFDIVISNHLLHHLSDTQFDPFVADSEALSTGVCLHSDIARGRAAYAGFAVGSAPVAPGTFLRVDGLRSIRRSYTREELQRRLPDRWRVDQAGPFRLWALRHASGPGGAHTRGEAV